MQQSWTTVLSPHFCFLVYLHISAHRWLSSSIVQLDIQNSQLSRWLQPLYGVWSVPSRKKRAQWVEHIKNNYWGTFYPWSFPHWLQQKRRAFQHPVLHKIPIAPARKVSRSWPYGKATWSCQFGHWIFSCSQSLSPKGKSMLQCCPRVGGVIFAFCYHSVCEGDGLSKAWTVTKFDFSVLPNVFIQKTKQKPSWMNFWTLFSFSFEIKCFKLLPI